MRIPNIEARLSRCLGGSGASSESSVTTTSIKDLAQAIAAAASPGTNSPTLALLDDPQVNLPVHNPNLTSCPCRPCPSLAAQL